MARAIARQQYDLLWLGTDTVLVLPNSNYILHSISMSVNGRAGSRSRNLF